MNGKVTYRQQFTRCGKAHCRRCQEGAGHGPYWYAYWNEQGSTVSKYVGARLPTHIAESQRDDLQEITTYLPTANSTSPHLRIYLLGQFRIERYIEGGWQAIDSHTWHRRRARALLGCLLSNPGRRSGRAQVMQQLWPDLEATVAANRLNGAVHELRQMLEPGIVRPATSRLLRLQRDILELADSTEIWVDAEAFEHILKEAYTTNDAQQAGRLLEEASALYQGSYLVEELYAEWAAPRRDALQSTWIELLLKLANAQIEQDAKARALDTLDHLRAADPTNELALQRLMLLLTQLDRRGEALQLYQQHRATLAQDYECEPVAETIRLYEQLRQGHVPHLDLGSDPQTSNTTQKPVRSTSTQPLLQTTTDASRQAPGIMRTAFQLARHNQSPLVGRVHELDRMRHILLTVAADIQASTNETASSNFILLRGEAGIGKTRLAEELSLEADTHGWAIAWHTSYEQDAIVPYHLWTQVLRSLSNSMAPPYPALDEREQRQQWEATGDILQTLSTAYPLLLVFDDLHWADEHSVELFIYLLQRLRRQRILFIGTCRDGELSPRHTLHTLIQNLQREQTITTITLNPLTAEQIGMMISYLPREAVISIQQQASGNPFFAEELARYISNTMVGAHPIEEQHTQRDPALPEAIAAVLDRRLAKLSHDCRLLLGKAAVLGGPFALQQLLPMSAEQSEERVLDLLDEALQGGLLREEGTGASITYHFWHPLIIDHLYSRLSATRKAQLQRRAAEARQAFIE